MRRYAYAVDPPCMCVDEKRADNAYPAIAAVRRGIARLLSDGTRREVLELAFLV